MIRKSIKYNGKKYKISFTDYCKCKYLIFKLFIKRVYGWRQVFTLTDFIIAFIILFTWGIVCYAISMASPLFLKNEWQTILINIMTSVIIVGFIGTVTRISQYKKINKEQYWIYQRIVTALDALFGTYYGEMIHHYEPFYCEESIKQTFCLVKNNSVNMTDREVLFYADSLQKRLDMLSNHLMSHSFHNCNVKHVLDIIYQCERYILAIKKDKRNKTKSYLEDLIFYSNCLLGEIGNTWKKDDYINKEIYRVIQKNGHNFFNDFYLRMKFYSVWEIKEFLVNQGEFHYEEDRLVYLTFLESDFPGENKCRERYGIKDYENRHRKKRVFDSL